MRSIYALALLIAIWAHPSHADPLQDRLESAIRAFGELIPHAPDVGLGWAQDRIDAAIAKSNPSSIVQTNAIGDWLLVNQPETDPQTRQRAEWLAATFKTVMGVNTVYSEALPSQSIRVAELQIRIKTALDKVTPGPSKEELAKELAESALRTGKEIEAMKQYMQYKRQWGDRAEADAWLKRQESGQ